MEEVGKLSLIESWNELVRKVIDFRILHVLWHSPEGRHQLVGVVHKGANYMLEMDIKHKSKGVTLAPELWFKDVEIRIQGQATQVEFFADGSFSQPLPPDHVGQPSIIIPVGDLPPGWSFEPRACFRARETVATKNLKFRCGVYGTLKPEGRKWRTCYPKV